MRYLRVDPASGLALVDAIVCVAESHTYTAEGPIEMALSIEGAARLAKDVRSLPESCAMRDGRKWKSIPFLILSMLGNYPEKVDGLDVIRYEGPDGTMRNIRRAVDEYRLKVLAEYEALGIMVRFISGRAQVGPALRKKDPNVQGAYYYSPADLSSNEGWVTFMREKEGVGADIEFFTALLDRRATETEMHRFFEEHPAFLMEARLGIPLSHPVTFAEPADWKPDFAIAPLFGPTVGSTLELLELKGPDEKLLTGKLHRGFSAKVHRAVDQVRDYERYLRDPANRLAIERGFGYVPDSSKLAVLIGRLPKKEGDLKIFRQRGGELDVQVITYDEILETQEKLIQLL